MKRVFRFFVASVVLFWLTSETKGVNPGGLTKGINEYFAIWLLLC